MDVQNCFSIAALLPSFVLAMAIIVGCVTHFAGAAFRGTRTLVRSIAGRPAVRTLRIPRTFQPATFNPSAPRISHATIGPLDR